MSIKTKFKRKPHPGVPVLRGFVSYNGNMINVFCPYCDKYHSHGWHPENPSWAIGLRIAHCSSPFKERYPGGGYHIGVLKAPEEKSCELFAAKRKEK
jgi:hypothetical protein